MSTGAEGSAWWTAEVPARDTDQVQPNPEVDHWFTTREHPMTEAMQRARQLILDADPRVSESIKWQTPTFSYRGNIVSFNPAKKMVSLLFHRGAEIPGDFPRLEGDGRLARVMRFADVGEVDEGAEELQSVIRAWCDSR
jgi:hypothetical protein